MLRLATIALTATALSTGVALAQNNNNDMSSNNTNAAASTQNQTIPQQLKDQLKQEGYTNVQVVPGSFLVSAKNKNGNPVEMVVGPRSITMVTMQKSGQSATTGSGQGNEGSSSMGSSSNGTSSSSTDTSNSSDNNK